MILINHPSHTWTIGMYNIILVNKIILMSSIIIYGAYVIPKFINRHFILLKQNKMDPRSSFKVSRADGSGTPFRQTY